MFVMLITNVEVKKMLEKQKELSVKTNGERSGVDFIEVS